MRYHSNGRKLPLRAQRLPDARRNSRLAGVMSYRVIRKISGRFYEYEQSTFRDKGRVRTISTYIRPATEAEWTSYRDRISKKRDGSSAD